MWQPNRNRCPPSFSLFLSFPLAAYALVSFASSPLNWGDRAICGADKGKSVLIYDASRWISLEISAQWNASDEGRTSQRGKKSVFGYTELDLFCRSSSFHHIKMITWHGSCDIMKLCTCPRDGGEKKIPVLYLTWNGDMKLKKKKAWKELLNLEVPNNDEDCRRKEKNHFLFLMHRMKERTYCKRKIKLKLCSVMLHIERFIRCLTRSEGFTFMGTFFFFYLYFVALSPVVIFVLTCTRWTTESALMVRLTASLQGH